MPSDRSPNPIQSNANAELERLSLHEYTLERVVPFQKPSQLFSSESLSSDLYVNGNSSINNRVKEYLSVENTMDSKCKKKAKHRGNRFRSHFPMASNLSGTPLNRTSSESNPIDLLGDERPEEDKKKQRPQTTFHGTAKDGSKAVSSTGSVDDLSQFRDTGERSRHFGASGKRALQTAAPDASKPGNRKLAQQFIDTMGNRRIIDVGYSSDELDSATTIGIVNKSSEKQFTPQAKSRRSSPMKYPSSSQKSMSSIQNEVSVPPSILPATTFSNSGAKRQGQKISAHRNSYSQEKKAPWGIPLSGISFGGEFKRSKSLGLEYDEHTQSYIVRDEGKNLTASYPSLRIQPAKLLKIFWADSGGKIRFESSKSGNDDTKLDLEVQSGKDCRDLLARLQDGNVVKVIGRSRHILEKMFVLHRDEQKRVLASPRSIVEDVPDDVLLAARNKQRRDGTEDKEGSEQGVHKRPRTGLRTIDKFAGGGYQDSALQASQVQSKTTAIFKDILGDEISNFELNTLNGKEDHLSTLERMLERTQAQNSHIPRSQIATRATFRKLKEPSPILDEFPEEERYSKKFGLGPRWTKSLTYPKVGKKKTTIDWSDLERLDEGQYLNDNLIGFYLRFLEQQAENRSPELLKKIYFFNTFFFASLTNTQKGKKPINYEGVQKWTRGIDLFTYDYVVVPINESTHWYVAIICNLAQLIQPPPEDDEIAAPPQSDSENDDESLNKGSAESVHPVSSPSPVTEIPIIPNARSGESEEKDPTASFADMSLETDIEKSTADRQKNGENSVITGVITANGSEEKDQEMLDAQIKADIAKPLIAEDAEAGERLKAQMEKEEHTGQAQCPKASPTKKRKRKSIPPIKKIDATQPAIITFDSLGAPHPPTIRILKSYLREEGLAKRNGMEFDETRLKGLTAKQIPQQDNFSDCGLFLLGYMDKFLENPKEFIDKIVKRDYDLQTDWPRMNPSEIRTNLRTLIQKLHAEQEEERLCEKRETARKAGKLVSKQPQEPEPNPSSDPLHADATHVQLTTVPGGSSRVDESTYAAPRSAQSRNEAWKAAITIDSQEPSNPPPNYSTNDEQTSLTESPVEPPRPIPTVPQDQLLITIDSQPSSLNPLTRPSPPEPRTPSPELASEIADSQPFIRPAEPPSSPPTLGRSPWNNKDQVQEFGISHDGLPSTSSLNPKRGEEMEELRARLRRDERKEKQNEKEREKASDRGRRRSVVEIDD